MRKKKKKKEESPYIVEVITKTVLRYNPDFGDDRDCACGHSYYRHFDSYEDMEPVGCKYCSCYHWKKPD